jgi:hypothetical protein
MFTAMNGRTDAAAALIFAGADLSATNIHGFLMLFLCFFLRMRWPDACSFQI